MTKMEEIKTQVNEYFTVLKEITEKRLLWESSTKDRLWDTLTNVVKSTSIRGEVRFLGEKIKNSEGIQLFLSDSPSGISETTNSGGKLFVKRGGFLNFSQLYNGDIVVIIGFPYVVELMEEINPLEIGKFHPSLITEEFIYDKVGIFLNKMIQWERSTQDDNLYL